MSALDPADIRRLKASLALLDSPLDGEKLAVIGAAKRLLDKGGLGFSDLEPTGFQPNASSINPKAERRAAHPERAGPPEHAPVMREHQRTALRLIHADARWNTKELQFLRDIVRWRRDLTEAQAKWLRDLEGRPGRQRTDRRAA